MEAPKEGVVAHLRASKPLVRLRVPFTLSRYEIDNGTIRFPLDEAVPRGLIVTIAQLRAAEELERPLKRRAKG